MAEVDLAAMRAAHQSWGDPPRCRTCAVWIAWPCHATRLLDLLTEERIAAALGQSLDLLYQPPEVIGRPMEEALAAAILAATDQGGEA